MGLMDKLRWKPRKTRVPTPAAKKRERGLSRPYVNEALAEADRIYVAKGAEAALVFLRVALCECPQASAKEIKRAVDHMREACSHEWVTTTNKWFPTGYLCAKCGRPRPEGHEIGSGQP